MTKVKVRLPFLDEHVPADGKLPDGLGLPVRVQYEGDPVGKVIAWEDQGDGTALAELDVDLPKEILAAPLSYGIDAGARINEGKVESIGTLIGVGVWADGTREMGEPPHTVGLPVPVDP